MNSPLEQFDILLVFFINTNNIFLTNFTLILFFSILLICMFYDLYATSFYFLYISFFQNFFEILLKNFIKLIIQNSTKKNQFVCPIGFVIGFLLFVSNLVGVIPFGLTATAQLILAFMFSFVVIFFVNFLGIQKHSIKFITLFIPKSTPLILLPILFSIEIISYNARLFSLAIRLFSNLLSGHALLKILITFFVITLSTSLFFFILNFLPMLLIYCIVFIEICIACLQCYIFIILISLYVSDALELH